MPMEKTAPKGGQEPTFLVDLQPENATALKT
jgi:hypothetical protein